MQKRQERVKITYDMFFEGYENCLLGLLGIRLLSLGIKRFSLLLIYTK